MRMLLSALVVGLLILAFTTSAYAVTCFLKGERVSGLNKICYYDCLGSEAAITIGAAQLCPIGYLDARNGAVLTNRVEDMESVDRPHEIRVRGLEPGSAEVRAGLVFYCQDADLFVRDLDFIIPRLNALPPIGQTNAVTYPQKRSPSAFMVDLLLLII